MRRRKRRWIYQVEPCRAFIFHVCAQNFAPMTEYETFWRYWSDTDTWETLHLNISLGWSFYFMLATLCWLLCWVQSQNTLRKDHVFCKNTYFGRHKHTWKCSQIKNTHTYKLELQLASFHACKSSDTNPPRRQVVLMWCEHEMTHILEATWCYGGNVNVSVVGGIFYLGERDITQHY